MAAARRRSREQWNALNPTYRKRLVSAARSGRLTGTPITGTPAQVERKAREAYIRGTSLTAARGKHPDRRRNLPPREATLRAAKGQATNADLRSLSTWQKTDAPKWIKDAGSIFSEDTAALLATISLQPQNWKRVTIYPKANGEYVVYIESRKGGKDRKVTLPDYASTQELEAYVRLLNTSVERPGEGVVSGLQFNRIADYSRSADTTPAGPLPTKKQGTAVPRKKK